LDPKARYRLTRFDSSDQYEATGEELLEKGLLISIGKAPGEAVIKYQSVPTANEPTEMKKQALEEQ
jgi:hypothetical protein